MTVRRTSDRHEDGEIRGSPGWAVRAVAAVNSRSTTTAAAYTCALTSSAVPAAARRPVELIHLAIFNVLDSSGEAAPPFSTSPRFLLTGKENVVQTSSFVHKPAPSLAGMQLGPMFFFLSLGSSKTTGLYIKIQGNTCSDTRIKKTVQCNSIFSIFIRVSFEKDPMHCNMYYSNMEGFFLMTLSID